MTEARRGPLHDVPRWFLVVTLIWSTLMLLLPWAIVAVLGDRLPDPVASHWGADGVPDGFTPRTTSWVWPLVLGGLLAVFLLGLGAAMRQLRPLASVTIGMVTFIGVLGAGSIAAQADGLASDARVDLALVVSIVSGVGVGAGAAWLLRKLSPVVPARRSPDSLPGAPLLRVAPGGDVSWTGRTRTSRGAVVGCRVGVTALIVPAIWFAVTGQWTLAGVLFCTGILIGVALLASLRASVSVDADGLRVRSLGRFTLTRIPLSNIERAAATVVHWGEFGGLGLRARIGSDGATGLITSSGNAVRVDRAGLGPFFVTLDPADEVAALINTLVARDATR